MASYIGKVQIGDNELNLVLIGSTLYGICDSPASATIKDITPTTYSSGNQINETYVNTSYDRLLRGTTIHIKFIHGNTATSSVSLHVGLLEVALSVVGNFVCPDNTIISFTLDEELHWIPNDNVNTEYEFMTAYNASTNKIATKADLDSLNILDAAHMLVTTSVVNGSTALPTSLAVYTFVLDLTGGLSGLTGAMHFRGVVTNTAVVITDGGTEAPLINGYDYENGAPKSDFSYVEGDVILYKEKEFVWVGDRWELLGDEGSYALKTSTAVVIGVASTTFTANTLPTLSTTITTVSSVNITNGTAPNLVTTAVSVPNVTLPGTATTASVVGGVLNILFGLNTELGNNINFNAVNSFTAGTTPQVISSTPISITSVTNWNEGSAASFGITTTSTIVVVPNSTTA